MYEAVGKTGLSEVTQLGIAVFLTLVLILFLTCSWLLSVVLQGEGLSWQSCVGFTCFWAVWGFLASCWWVIGRHAKTVFTEGGIYFCRGFAASVFVPWNELKQVRRMPWLLRMWVFTTAAGDRVWLDMLPFRVWIVEGIILEHVSADCELVGRFRNWESIWD